jgi:uncharacterized protein DUF3854
MLAEVGRERTDNLAAPTPPLSVNHLRMLTKESGIYGQIVTQRGYWTATRRSQLEGLVRPYQRRVPALVIPTYSPDGETTSLQLRPDSSRIRAGKAIKYETPADSRCILDVHPAMRAKLREISEPLWITEGIKKGDALASRGCCAISVMGVWNWQRGGQTLPCWDHVALEGRTVFLAFDSDVMAKPEVQLALERLAEALEDKGAAVNVVYLPEVADG